MPTDHDDPRIKLMQKWSQEMPEYNMGSAYIGADGDDDNAGGDEDYGGEYGRGVSGGVSSLFLGIENKGNEKKKNRKGKGNGGKKGGKSEPHKKHHDEYLSKITKENSIDFKVKAMRDIPLWIDNIKIFFDDESKCAVLGSVLSHAKNAHLAIRSYMTMKTPTSVNYDNANNEVKRYIKLIRESGPVNQKKRGSKYEKVDENGREINPPRVLLRIKPTEYNNTATEKGFSPAFVKMYYAGKLYHSLGKALYTHFEKVTYAPNNKQAVTEGKTARQTNKQLFHTDPYHITQDWEEKGDLYFKTLEKCLQVSKQEPGSGTWSLFGAETRRIPYPSGPSSTQRTARPSLYQSGSREV